MQKFSILVLISCALTLFVKTEMLSEAVYFSSFAEQLSYSQIKSLVTETQKWQWLGYVLTPVVYLIKCSLVALCLGMGVYFVTGKFEFKRLFHAAVIAEFVFLLPVFVKIIWFLFVQTDYSLSDIQLFAPLSVLNFFDRQHLEPWLVYPLQVVNLFELIYWIVLAYTLTTVLPKINLSRSMEIVASSYGVGLALWVLVITFVSFAQST